MLQIRSGILISGGINSFDIRRMGGGQYDLVAFDPRYDPLVHILRRE